MLMSIASPRPVFAALHTVEASEVTSCESKATFKHLRIQLSSRSEKRLTECVAVEYTHVYITVTCMYNLYSKLTRALYTCALVNAVKLRSTSCDDNVIALYNIFCKFSAPFGYHMYSRTQ